MPRLYGNRIMLREYKKEDLSYIREWVNNSKITDMLSDIFLFPHSLRTTEKFLDMMIESERKDMCGFVIADKRTEEYIGQIDLIKIDWKNRKAIMGIIIGREENHSKGYGTEAINLLLEFCFQRLGLNKLELEVREYNKKAIRCYEKCGFKVEGIFKEDRYIYGRFTDTYRMAILRKEWEELNKIKR
ncbi:Protein N-acetyltransferase, RimJ/RimL family [Caminicella sporogenes DSM 14501]|uniref:Protein N-acetyltransferase, RimJ/RimL family n=1 Tax=Caminicella sporogenes DSM 14501 TaxID=1121266 RepID=A0A1M6N3L6_9FIRM|nr:GNAT family protein [Caminicella sporogenes]RKD22376.1 GNAT family N-acetyltransferase [Caminicella sporogenes]WIF95171.1 GNAT family protein [Caminicella sporogenes]SHJ90309.1 Protein N-acetyltransferase, RimJ/RimL family [Caminicella sporogenes DSM 14501]